MRTVRILAEVEIEIVGPEGNEAARLTCELQRPGPPQNRQVAGMAGEARLALEAATQKLTARYDSAVQPQRKVDP